jgi:hypothetical protein
MHFIDELAWKCGQKTLKQVWFHALHIIALTFYICFLLLAFGAISIEAGQRWQKLSLSQKKVESATEF